MAALENNSIHTPLQHLLILLDNSYIEHPLDPSFRPIMAKMLREANSRMQKLITVGDFPHPTVRVIDNQIGALMLHFNDILQLQASITNNYYGARLQHKIKPWLNELLFFTIIGIPFSIRNDIKDFKQRRRDGNANRIVLLNHYQILTNMLEH